MGFEFSHRESHPTPTVKPFPVKSGVTNLSGGCLVNMESGTVDLAVTNDTKLVGLVLAPEDPTHNLAALPEGASVMVITDADAVYRVADANARNAGATLDLAAGAKSLAASTNADVVVTTNSTSAQNTHVQISRANHYLESV